MSRFHLLVLILSFVFTSCEESETTITPDNTEVLSNTTPNNTKPANKDEQAFELVDLDTSIFLSDTIYVNIKYLDTSFTTSYFTDQYIIDSLTENIDHHYTKAKVIQDHQLRSVTGSVKYDTSSISLKLANGNWEHLISDTTEISDYYLFERYFKKLGYYSVFVQMYEGSYYIMVSEKSGTKTYLLGRPYFSPSGKYMISTNADLEAGYTKNGFDLYYNVDGELQLLTKLEPKDWAPTNVLWLDDNHLLINCYILNYQGDNFYKYFTIKLTVND